MRLIDLLIRFSQQSFPCTIGNIAVAIIWVALVGAVVMIGLDWILPRFWEVIPMVGLLSVIPLLLMLAFVNRRAWMQLVYESHGAKAFHDNRFAESEAYFRKSLSLAESLGRNDLCRIGILQWLMAVTRMQGNYDEAESFAQQWVSASEKALGADHNDTLDAVEMLADVYAELSRYPEAERLLERSLRSREAKGETETLGYARCLHRLGGIALDLDRAESAETLLRHAVEIVNRHNVALTNDGLAIIRDFQFALIMCGRTDEAALIAEQTIASLKRANCRNNWLVADATLTLGLVRGVQGRAEESESLIRRALALVEAFGDNRPELRDFHIFLARALRDQAKNEEAEVHFRKAISLIEEYFSPIHPKLASTLEEYAEMLMDLGRVSEAEPMMQRAQQIRGFHI